MKTNIPSKLTRFLLLGAALSAVALAKADAAEDEGSTAAVKLSAPGKPATLNLDVPWADIRITGTDGDTVTVESTLTQTNAKPARPGALRRLDNEVSFELTEKDNVVTLSLAGDNPWGGHDAEFRISVPRAIALNLKTAGAIAYRRGHILVLDRADLAMRACECHEVVRREYQRLLP